MAFKMKGHTLPGPYQKKSAYKTGTAKDGHPGHHDSLKTKDARAESDKTMMDARVELQQEGIDETVKNRQRTDSLAASATRPSKVAILEKHQKDSDEKLEFQKENLSQAEKNALAAKQEAERKYRLSKGSRQSVHNTP